jgi:hypothetical protein
VPAPRRVLVGNVARLRARRNGIAVAESRLVANDCGAISNQQSAISNQEITMKKTTIASKKLRLHAQTLHVLSTHQLKDAGGGLPNTAVITDFSDCGTFNCRP